MNDDIENANRKSEAFQSLAAVALVGAMILFHYSTGTDDEWKQLLLGVGAGLGVLITVRFVVEAATWRSLGDVLRAIQAYEAARRREGR